MSAIIIAHFARDTRGDGAEFENPLRNRETAGKKRNSVVRKTLCFVGKCAILIEMQQRPNDCRRKQTCAILQPAGKRPLWSLWPPESAPALAAESNSWSRWGPTGRLSWIIPSMTPWRRALPGLFLSFATTLRRTFGRSSATGLRRSARPGASGWITPFRICGICPRAFPSRRGGASPGAPVRRCWPAGS